MTPTLPTHDEDTGRLLLTKGLLVHGAYYVGRCRNATVARWNAEKQCFYHWQENFGALVTETIKHPIDDEVFDVFRPYRLLETPEFEIPFDDTPFQGDRKSIYAYNEEAWCSCERLQHTCPHCRYRQLERQR